METLIPKLAHFYGHALDDVLLPGLDPGYRPDPDLTEQYRQMTETYLGTTVLIS